MASVLFGDIFFDIGWMFHADEDNRQTEGIMNGLLESSGE